MQLGLAFTLPAHALTIKATFDSSITSLSAAPQIEAAFNAAASIFQNAFTDPVTVNIPVSWGKVNGQTIGSGILGASWVQWNSGYTQSQVKSYLKAAATTANDTIAVNNLPTVSPAGNSFDIPRAEAKALGLLSSTSTASDGYIGFGYTPSSFTFNDSAGVASGTYDFIGIAAHEIEEVLGRISTLNSTSPSGATIFDLFRYGAAGNPNFSRTAASYFSIDGGVTNLDPFNISGGGDRSDWSSVAGTATDAQLSYLTSGTKFTISTSDLVALDILGWDSRSLTTPSPGSTGGGLSAATVAEPPSLVLLGTTLLGVALLGRRARRI